MIRKETSTERERTSVKAGLPMEMEAIGGQEQTSERIGPLTDAVAYMVPARTLGRDGREILKEIFMEPAKILAGDFRRMPRATYTEPERTLGKVGSMMRIKVVRPETH